MTKQFFLKWSLLLSVLTASISLFAAFPAFADDPLGVQLQFPARPAADQPIIIDHDSTSIAAVPQAWLQLAAQSLHIGYGHTSHGSQLTSGMTELVDFANNGGLGLALPQDIFEWNYGGSDGVLDLREGDGYGDGDLDHDCGYFPNWVDETRAYLGNADPDTGRGENHPEINVIMWSWCGQAAGYSEQDMIDRYLSPMAQLEIDYPGVTFIYMTGHADGTGEDGNLHLRNQQIRDYALANNKVLFDFYDIELYDPDGNYYGDKFVTDNCDYDSDGDGSQDSNWAIDWQNSHTEGTDWFSSGCAHSQSLNCNQKAYAVWWLLARLAGWDGTATTTDLDLSASAKTASTSTARAGDLITYTVTLNAVGNSTGVVTVTDTLPNGLAYADGSLTESAGSGTFVGPVYTWHGTVDSTLPVTLTYAAQVETTQLGSLQNSAVLELAGQETITRTATVVIVKPFVYLPLLLKD